MMKEVYADTLEALCKRVLATRNEVGADWPYYADPTTGRWVTTDDGDWCDGHWIDMLRMTGELTHRRQLVDEALDRTEKVRYKLERMTSFGAIDFIIRPHVYGKQRATSRCKPWHWPPLTV